jgi:glycosyltransferase involved in cell wall biosynthesis
MMTTPIKIAMLIQAYHPRVGGAERQLAYIAPRLQSSGFEVHVITRRYAGLKPFEMIDGVPVHRLPIAFSKPIAAASYTLAALNLIWRLRPDVLHAHDLLSTSTTAILAGSFLNSKVVSTAHRGGTLGDVYILSHRFLGLQRMNLVCRRVDKFVTISREIDTELGLNGVIADKRINIPNGVDVERFIPILGDQRMALRQTLGLQSASPVVIYAGRLVPEKRVEYLIREWPSIRAVFPNAVLLILGTGEMEPFLRRSAGDGVRFEGSVEDVTPYLQVADLFVLPSITEGLPVSILEALATKVPVLATRVGGVPDIIEHGYNGWLVPPDDSSALRDALLALLGEPLLLSRLADNGREYVLRNHGLPEIANRLGQVYNSLIAKPA